MKKSPVLLALTGALVLGGALLLPRASSGQAPAAGDPELMKLILEVAVQQRRIGESHVLIDEKLAAIAEDLRVARIFVGRGGGKAK